MALWRVGTKECRHGVLTLMNADTKLTLRSVDIRSIGKMECWHEGVLAKRSVGTKECWHFPASPLTNIGTSDCCETVQAKVFRRFGSWQHTAGPGSTRRVLAAHNGLWVLAAHGRL